MVEKKKKTAAATAKHHFSARDPTYELGAQGQVRHIAAFSIVYVAIIALIAVLWDGLAIEFPPRPLAAVWLRMCHNRTAWVEFEQAASFLGNASSRVGSEPRSLKLKLLAVYVAEGLNLTTHRPRYSADADDDAGAPMYGAISAAQDARRVWTHPACDPDGDGHIGDCDVSYPLKYRWQLRASLDLADAHPVPFNAVRHEVRAGEYSYVVLQTCLENAQNASLFEVVGGSMGEDERYSWRAPPPAHGTAGRCFFLARPLRTPLVLRHGDDALLTLTCARARAIDHPRNSTPAQFADALAQSSPPQVRPRRHLPRGAARRRARRGVGVLPDCGDERDPLRAPPGDGAELEPARRGDRRLHDRPARVPRPRDEGGDGDAAAAAAAATAAAATTIGCRRRAFLLLDVRVGRPVVDLRFRSFSIRQVW